MDLNLMNIEDIPCTNEAIRCLISIGREKMPYDVGIVDFDYCPLAPEPETVLKGEEAREAYENAEAMPAVQDPLLLRRGNIR
jgi:hypothetical protein